VTPMHFQYLVGLCCLQRHPDAVEMTIGDRVRDSASESDRDVDVTIVVAEPSGERTGFMGYDAKMEKDPLCVDTVEQLCAKLNDMPGLTMRAIVSAKGFSKTAIRKAKKHGVKLFEFREWKESVKAGFPHTSMEGSAAECMLFGQREFRWVESNQPAQINPDDATRIEYLADIKNDMPLFQADGSPHPKYRTVKDYFDTFTIEISGRLSQRPEAQAVWMAPLAYPPDQRPDGPVGEPVHFPNVRCHIQEAIFFQTRKGLRAIEYIQFSAALQWYHKRVPVEFRALVDVESQQIYAGAGITSDPIHADVLMAVTLSADNAHLVMHPIRLTEKQKNFIHKLQVRL
jgi:hypothetical protein